ncbi:MAG TPA: hypothetical protein DCY93_03050, partial [Firmicutes bacterium]|nr:hypothetical protein [Bacillota bacterium]
MKRRVLMKICEFIKQFDERYPSLLEKERALENLLKRKEELHICDLDCSLIILVMINNYNDLNIKNVLNEHKEILNAALDYLHGKYLESDLIKMTTNEQSRNDEDVSSSFFDIVLNKKLSQECINEINERQLLNEIDLNNLDETQKKQRKTQSDLKIEVRGNLIYSFALSQTKFKIIKEIIIKNVSEQTIKNGRITISSNPKYIDFTDIEVSLINPHQSVSVTEIEVTPHIEDLMQLVERTEGKLVVQFFVNDEEFTTVSVDISYYSYDTRLENFISGSTALFVTPNDTAVKNVLSLVAKEMKGIAGSTSLSGYLHEDKDNVVNQLKALYNVIHKEAIAYLISPASYEKAGQKVRLPHDVLVHKQGNCLDLTILFASCIEQMGLNPFFVEITGHAFVGVFLSDDTFPSLIYTDAPHALEMNSEEENDIIFIECTAGTADNSYSFEQACLLGREHVSKSISDANFKIIDITRARHEGFLPLPINYEFERAVVDYEVVKQNNIRLARKKYSHKGEKIELTKAEVNRFDIWQKKLLDLSKKNQLVNYRPLGKGLQLYFYDLNALYDAFRPKDSENEKKKIYNVFLESDKGNFNFELSNVTEDKYKEILRDFENGRIKLITHSPIQETSLKFFERERRKSFEETGSNILYLAIGFIQYFEDDKSKKPVYAPIILVPINLNRHSIDSYTISGRGEPPFLNISIFEYFRQEFGVNCDDLLTQISFDIDKVDINSILNTVSAKITEKKRTSIVRTAAINIFNFSKAVMWSDVRFRKEEMSKNKVIKSIIEGRYVIDDEDKINDTFDDDNSNPADLAIPLAADSSQIIAIKDCAEGKSFILQGPPGTGKSQTITNMIVNAIYHNKTVLFVAEKMAALEVVQKRLNELCLGKFALEAHSAKADKSSLMAQFDKRISLGATAPSSEEYKEIASKLKSQRLALNRVINLLHKKKGYMLSFYDALVNYLDIDENVPTISFQDSYVKNLTLQKFADSSSICGKLFNQVELNHGYYDNPFLLYRDSNYTPGVTKNQLLEQTKVFKEKLSNYINASKAFLNDNSLTLEIDRTKFDALQDFLREDQKVMKCIPALIHHDIKSLDKYILDIIKIGKIYQKKLLDIKSDFAESILDIDYESKQIKFETLSKSFFIKKFFGQKKLYKEIKP